jgi:TolA-binding protein
VSVSITKQLQSQHKTHIISSISTDTETCMDPNTERRKDRLIGELQERIKIIQHDIARLEFQINTATEEKRVHEEDLQFHLQLLEELGAFQAESKSEEEKTSIEIIDSPQPRERESGGFCSHRSGSRVTRKTNKGRYTRSEE